jgi:hypothetical protein
MSPGRGFDLLLHRPEHEGADDDPDRDDGIIDIAGLHAPDSQCCAWERGAAVEYRQLGFEPATTAGFDQGKTENADGFLRGHLQAAGALASLLYFVAASSRASRFRSRSAK